MQDCTSNYIYCTIHIHICVDLATLSHMPCVMPEAVQIAQASSAQNATGLGSQAGVRDLATTLSLIQSTPLRGAKDRLVSAPA